jgi:hypothetical protein
VTAHFSPSYYNIPQYGKMRASTIPLKLLKSDSFSLFSPYTFKTSHDLFKSSPLSQLLQKSDYLSAERSRIPGGIHGFVAPGYEPVKTLFIEQLQKNYRKSLHGAAVSAYGMSVIITMNL